MADWAKIAIKTALIVVLAGAIFSLLFLVQFPAIQLTPDMLNGIGKAKAFFTYWLPNFDVLFGFVMGVFAFELGIMLYKFSVNAAKWLWKVNE